MNTESRVDRLPKPLRLTEQTWADAIPPVVSIICITYNHAKFIAQCLESFLMQETTFRVEIVVHDDASTDGTSDIVRDYTERYPKLIRAILREKNQYGKAGAMIDGMLGMVRGTYYALCEGDDYWTYSGKLEAQVGILANRPDLVMVSHEVTSVDETGRALERWRRLKDSESVEYVDLDVLKTIFNHPNTWIVRSNTDISRMIPLFNTLPMGDDPWNLALLQQGGRGLSLGERWTAYRQHAGGVWSTLAACRKGIQQLVLLVSQKRYYAPRYDDEYRPLVHNQRRVVAALVTDEIVGLNLRNAAGDLLYIASFSSPFFRGRLEAFGIALLAIAMTASRGLKKILGRSNWARTAP